MSATSSPTRGSGSDDVNVGTVTKIERQGWHALITMRLNGDVNLPANATAKIGQTSLLGTLHVELAPPTGRCAAEGKLHDGSLIPLSPRRRLPDHRADAGGGCRCCSTAADWARSRTSPRPSAPPSPAAKTTCAVLFEQLDEFVGHLNDQTDDIIAATDSLNNLVGQFAEQKPLVDKALQTIPDALAVLSDQRDNLAEALDQFGKFSALAADSVNQTKKALVEELKDLGPGAGFAGQRRPALTRSLSLLAHLPVAQREHQQVVPRRLRQPAPLIFDLTLSRLDTALFTGTRWEGNLTELEMQWGRTIGQLPSPVHRPAIRWSFPTTSIRALTCAWTGASRSSWPSSR